jgi:hypothetical protein
LSVSVSPEEASTLPWSALFAWLVAVACVALGWHRRRALEGLAPPERQRLLDELTGDEGRSAEHDEPARRLAIAELNQRLADVSFELDVLPATYTALIRISLASGSALALVSFVTANDEVPLARALRLAIAALGGLLGAGTVAAIGRSARARTRQIRDTWDSSSREIGKTLGTSLAGPPAPRGNSFPA